MLERSSLLLRPCSFVEGIRIRPIHDPLTDERVGSARDSRSAARGWSPLRKREWQVLETEDESLVMSVRRPWGLFRVWRVVDAEERHVGGVYGASLFQQDGVQLAQMRWTPGNHEAAWVARNGKEIASWQRLRDGDVVFRFAESLESSPFLRMIALAGTLVATEEP